MASASSRAVAPRWAVAPQLAAEQRPEDSPNRGAEKRGGKADEEGNACPINAAREQVSAKLVRPKWVDQTGRAKLQVITEFVRVVVCNEVSKDGGEDHDQNDHASRCSEGFGPDEFPNGVPETRPG